MSDANYGIDTGNGDCITTGLQGYEQARQVAQRAANERGESVYLYELVSGDDQPPAEEITPR